jgi:hypothetical protein
MSTAPDARAPIPAGSRYVAMGSSFAAGPGIAPRAPRHVAQLVLATLTD